ncbi:MAG: histidine phosphatase family protein [Propionibacteriaceae bacterium]|nr:histidine phosphatase family protein [Propionibacteriaceae bacterium]
MAVVHVMRHGQVDNPEGVLYERLPGFHLTELGRDMAAQSATFFHDLPITHLRCSPLERTQETMKPVAALFPTLEVHLDERVIEAGNRFAGQVMGGSAKAAKNPKNWPFVLNPFRPSWGEPYAAIAERMLEAIKDSADIVGDSGQAVIVSHQLPIWMAHLRATGRRLFHDPRKRQCSLASITSFHVTSGEVTKIEYVEPALDLLPNPPMFGF